MGSLRKAAIQGDLQWGSLMMGQVAGMIHEIKPLQEVLDEMIAGSIVEYRTMKEA
jgi:enoyl-[acyl-carrier protein] reductase II